VRKKAQEDTPGDEQRHASDAMLLAAQEQQERRGSRDQERAAIQRAEAPDFQIRVIDAADLVTSDPERELGTRAVRRAHHLRVGEVGDEEAADAIAIVQVDWPETAVLSKADELRRPANRVERIALLEHVTHVRRVAETEHGDGARCAGRHGQAQCDVALVSNPRDHHAERQQDARKRESCEFQIDGNAGREQRHGKRGPAPRRNV
jgi:hypothetical protein